MSDNFLNNFWNYFSIHFTISTAGDDMISQSTENIIFNKIGKW